MGYFARRNGLMSGDVVRGPKSGLDIVQHFVIFLWVSEEGNYMVSETVTNFSRDTYTQSGAYQLQKDYHFLCNSHEYFYNDKDKAKVIFISTSPVYKYPMKSGNEEMVYPVSFDFATTPTTRISAEEFMKLNSIPFDRSKYMQ